MCHPIRANLRLRAIRETCNKLGGLRLARRPPLNCHATIRQAGVTPEQYCSWPQESCFHPGTVLLMAGAVLFLAAGIMLSPWNSTVPGRRNHACAAERGHSRAPRPFRAVRTPRGPPPAARWGHPTQTRRPRAPHAAWLAHLGHGRGRVRDAREAVFIGAAVLHRGCGVPRTR